MKEIKFRVFAHQKDDDGCIGYLETRSPAATGIDFFYDGGWRGIGYFLNHPKIFTVQQFTGLLDKNGKEIYEGDILQYKLSYSEFTCVVEWQNYGWVMQDFEYDSANPICGAYDPLIIGNIMENPELTK